MGNSGLSQYKLTAVVTATAALATGTRVMAVLVKGGSDASGVEIKDAATDTGTVLLNIPCPLADSRFVDLTNLGGVAFSTGIFVKPSGTSAIVYVWTS